MDTRKEPDTIKLDLEKAGLIVEKQKLDAGDYCVGQFLIERKTIDDFFNTLSEGRLFPQLLKLKNSDKKSVLVIIGNFPKRHGKMSKAQMEARIKTLSYVAFLSFNVLFIRVQTQEKFTNLIKWLWQRSNTKTYAPVVTKKSYTVEEIRSDMLCCIPGIGRKLGDELSQYTWIELMNMSEESLTNYRFSGRKLGKRAKMLIQLLK